jgi:hypothetical protein
MTTPMRSGRFHVVCHDCPHEQLTTDADEARRLVRDHTAETGHTVESERIA